MRTIVAIVICLQVTLGTVWGIREPRSWHQTDIDAGRVTANISTASDQLVVSALYPNPFVTASSLRGLTKEAEVHRLSTVPDGEYSIRSAAHTSAGDSGESVEVPIAVSN